MRRVDGTRITRAWRYAPRGKVAAVVLAVLVAWRALLGWDWTVRQSTFDWVAFGLVAMLGVGWLALGGRGTAGTVAVTVPVIVLSAWRMAASGVTGWPVGLASLIFSLSVTCVTTAVLGAGLRRAAARRDVSAGP